MENKNFNKKFWFMRIFGFQGSMKSQALRNKDVGIKGRRNLGTWWCLAAISILDYLLELQYFVVTVKPYKLCFIVLLYKGEHNTNWNIFPSKLEWANCMNLSLRVSLSLSLSSPLLLGWKLTCQSYTHQNTLQIKWNKA